MNSAWKFSLLCLTLLVLMSSAHAHKLNLFAFEEAGKIFVEGYFSDGIKPKTGKIKVFDSTGTLLYEGKTDNDGSYVFPKPNVNEYRIELDAGLGHKSALGMKGGEIFSKEEDQASGSKELHSASNTMLALGSNDELRSIVRQAVAEATRPLAREIAELKTKTKFSDIVGGIGFILGLLGIFAYLTARKG